MTVTAQPASFRRKSQEETRTYLKFNVHSNQTSVTLKTKAMTAIISLILPFPHSGGPLRDVAWSPQFDFEIVLVSYENR